MSLKKNHIQQYLERHSHGVNIGFFNDCLKKSTAVWQAVIILPVCGESADCINNVFSTLKNMSCLAIVCVNRPAKHTKTKVWQQQNQNFIEAISQTADQIFCHGQTHKLLLGVKGVDCLLLDFNQQPFDKHKAVGLARKIAADTALSLIDKGWISKNWIFSTDADVILPKKYLSVVDGLNSSVAAVSLKFKHCGHDKKALTHQAQYDFKLKYYQQGVNVINPSYSYIPLGSTLIIHAETYAKVRGFPSRSGGEDFYILNKLAKLGKVIQPPEPVITIKVRYSDRVPFGTGPAISQLAETDQPPEYYHPEIFFILKQWRIGLLNFFSDKQLPESQHGLNQYWQIERVLNKGIKQYKTEKQWRKFVDDWFDAFRILKSVHFLSVQFLPVKIEVLKRLESFQKLAIECSR